MLWILTILGVIAAGFFAGAESAFVASPRLRVRHLAHQGSTRAAKLENALRSPGPYLSTLLVGTNLAVIGGTVAATRLAEGYYEGHGEAVATAILSPVFLILSEIIPKSYFLAHARTLCLHIVGPLMIFRKLFHPIVLLVGAPAKALGVSETEPRLPVTREELVLLARLGRKRTRLGETVGSLLHRRVAAARPLAHEIMVPATGVVDLPYDGIISDALPIIYETGFSRYPLRKMDTWAGLVHVVDVVGAPAGTPLAELSHPIPIVDGSAPLSDIITSMREAGEHMALARVHGKIAGLLTLEDIVRHLTLGYSEDSPS